MAVSAGAVVLMMVLMPIASAGTAHANGLTGLTWTASWSNSVNGCASAKGVGYKLYTSIGNPTERVVTGTGSTSAHTCGPANGGSATSSFASVYDSLNIQVPLQLKASSPAVNVTWTVNDSTLANARQTGQTPCSSTHKYVDDYYYNNSWPVYNSSTGNVTYVSTWYNYTSIDTSCSATATITLYVSAYLIDTTTGRYVLVAGVPLSTYFSNTTGKSQSNSTYWVNYSNPTIASYNVSTGYDFASSWSTGTLGGPYTLTWLFNSTFNSKHTYVLYTSITTSLDSSVYGYAKATASSRMAFCHCSVSILR